MYYRTFKRASWLLVVVSALVLSGCGGGGNNVEISNLHWSTGQFGNKMVSGTAKNISSRQLSYVQVEINLYDESGAQVGSTLANVNNLEPNGTWKFDAPIMEDGVTQAKVAGVTSF